jgi:hypothetical protein
MSEIKRMQQLAGLLKEDSTLEGESSSLNEVEVDMMGKKCKTCGKGVYRETSQMDDMKGVLHCSKCGAETERYIDSTKVNEASNITKILRKIGWDKDWTPQDYAKQIKNLSDSTLKMWYDDTKKNKGIPNTPLAFQQKLVKIEMEKRGLNTD